MSAKLVITNDGLKEVGDRIEGRPILTFLKNIATFLSYVFHPVFVPLYVMGFLLFIEPFLFVGETYFDKILTFARAFINYTFFPLVSVLLLKALNFISSIRLKDKKDRIIPFVVCNIWYFWMWYVWRGLPEVPHFLVIFAMGIFLASSIGLLANIYLKISMHGIALGTATAFLCLLTFNPSSPNLSIYLALAIFITGLIGSCRLLLGDHTPKEYYYGVGAGTIAIIIADLIA